MAARQPFLAELSGLGRRRSLDSARLAVLYGDASAILDRLLLHFIATHQAPAADVPSTAARPAPSAGHADRGLTGDGHPHRPPGDHVDPGARLQPRPVRPVARATRRLPAHLGLRDAVLRHRRGRARRWPEPGGWNEALYRTWYLTGAVWTAGWLGLGTAFLLGRTRFGYSFALCLLLAGVFTLLTQRRFDYPGAGSAPILYLIAAVILALAVAVETYFQNERWPDPRGRRRRRRDGPVGRPDADRDARPARLRARSRDRHAGRHLFPGTLRLLTPFLNITGSFALILGAVFSTYVFMPKRRVLPYSLDPNQPGDEFLFNLLIAPVAIAVNLVASLPGTVRALLTGRIHSRVPATILIAIGGLHPGHHRLASTGSARRSCSSTGKFLGVLFLFAGFLVSIEVFREVRIPFTSIRLGRSRRERPEEAAAPVSAATAEVVRTRTADPRAVRHRSTDERRSAAGRRSALPWPGVQPHRQARAVDRVRRRCRATRGRARASAADRLRHRHRCRGAVRDARPAVAVRLRGRAWSRRRSSRGER